MRIPYTTHTNVRCILSLAVFFLYHRCFGGLTGMYKCQRGSRHSLVELKPPGVVVAARWQHREVHVHAVLLSPATAAAATVAAASRQCAEANGHRQVSTCNEATAPRVEVVMNSPCDATKTSSLACEPGGGGEVCLLPAEATRGSREAPQTPRCWPR